MHGRNSNSRSRFNVNLNWLVITNKVQEKEKNYVTNISINQETISFTADICCMIHEYCDDACHSELVVTSLIYHRIKALNEFVISEEGYIKVTSDDSVVQFARKVADILVVYGCTHDVDIEKMAEAIWYATTRVYFEDTYTEQYKELLAETEVY